MLDLFPETSGSFICRLVSFFLEIHNAYLINSFRSSYVLVIMVKVMFIIMVGVDITVRFRVDGDGYSYSHCLY